ncbi:Phosphate starvation-inducible protein PhoH, predicted ATPase [Desulfurella amilsii]|uniref:PhoH-like protein n=1 Tax=Desulfurella amilsii TaxID=1562698 RepID=A0A1X4Y055_9BACT|nr:PhoH family protein [Desulfurella amilsii]OSS43133.1 Phosphate starvation-inducible protein PhoH, predicted ATPase [Desulfurella amilsii]
MEKRLVLSDPAYLGNVFYNRKDTLKKVEKKLNVFIVFRGGEVLIKGSDKNIQLAYNYLKNINDMVDKGILVEENAIDSLISELDNGNALNAKAVFNPPKTHSKIKAILPKNVNQAKYLELIEKNTMTFGIGPAGTGKTYLAVFAAINALLEKRVKRIILTRPAVEAGEKLGFLPGTLYEKIDPYMKPLYDAIYDCIETELALKLIDQGKIEIEPLAYMRGRTLNNAFIILDEAQNTTVSQMKMFLTRTGFDSKVVITGDITQIDLPYNIKSGLADAVSLLRKLNLDSIGFVDFKKEDVLRNPIVSKIVEAYEKRDKDNQESKNTY